MEKTLLKPINTSVEDITKALQEKVTSTDFIKGLLKMEGPIKFHKYKPGYLVYSGKSKEDGAIIQICVDIFTFNVSAEFQYARGLEWDLGQLYGG